MALFLFATIAYPLLSVFANYYRTSGKAQSMLVASHLAEQQMETQLALGWQAIDVAPTPAVVTYIKNGTEIPVTYTTQVEVNDLSDTGNPLNLGMKQILVTVEWTDTTGDRNLVLESLVYWGG